MKGYLEQSVAGKRTVRSSALYGLCWALIVVLGAQGLVCAAGIFGGAGEKLTINWLNAAVMAVSLALAGFVFVRKDYLRMEYDYILRGGELEIVAILNNRRRRRLARIELERVSRMGSADGADFEAALRQPGLRRHAWHVRADGLVYLCYMENGVRNMALLELSAEMIAEIRGLLQSGAWRNAEGETWK